MARRVSEIDPDPLAETPEARPVLRANASAEPAAESAAPGTASLLHPALDDIAVDLGGGVYAPVVPNLVINGTPGNDAIWGGDGDDLISGLGGDDFISGGLGNDTLAGNAGNDMIFGGEGHDKISGNDGDDLLRGNGGNDKLYGMGGNDLLEGSEGDDALDGGDGLDALFGGDGKDSLKGGGFSDTLDGGAGSDRLEGGKGRDTLTGGEGRDFFVADLNGDIWNNHHYRPDVITDFTAPGAVRDCIDLRVIMAKTNFTGTTVQQAVDQGYLSLSEYQNGDGTYGTYIVIDRTGHAPDPHGEGALRMFDLQGVHATELGFNTFASHFLL